MNLRSLSRLFFSLFFSLAFLTPRIAQAADKEIFNGYQVLTSALSADHYKDTQDIAKRLVEIADGWLQRFGFRNPEETPSMNKVAEGLRAMGKTSDATELRKHYSTVSEGITALMKRNPQTQKEWQLYQCPMVEAPNFPMWAQPINQTMANPYMGTKLYEGESMLQCGVKKRWAVLP